jgi:hypothetical protein
MQLGRRPVDTIPAGHIRCRRPQLTR